MHAGTLRRTRAERSPSLSERTAGMRRTRMPTPRETLCLVQGPAAGNVAERRKGPGRACTRPSQRLGRGCARYNRRGSLPARQKKARCRRYRPRQGMAMRTCAILRGWCVILILLAHTCLPTPSSVGIMAVSGVSCPHAAISYGGPGSSGALRVRQTAVGRYRYP